MADPLHQFQIRPWIDLSVAGTDVSFTNSAAAMSAAVIIATIGLTFGMRHRATFPGRWQAAAEMIYEFIASMVREHIGPEGRRYFPFVFSIFAFVLLGNLIGMAPYGFTFTSHIIVTFALALIVVSMVTIVGFVIHGWRFLTLFMPKDVPLILSPILVPIEIISYLSRAVSLSVRLFANMMAGHTMLKVFAGFSVSLGASMGLTGYALGLLPVTVNVLLVAFEILIALLQAYVFTILTCLYLRDAVHLH
ncbi:MAG: F0F1 ATP synthase subunit A [Pseudomonadota bacterium]|nr:F0F1 ATP synthase subunit A [Pseudomonadota bacterium]